MLTGLPPFYDDDHSKMFEKIMTGDLKLDQPFMSKEVKNMLAGMLERDSSVRYQSIA